MSNKFVVLLVLNYNFGKKPSVRLRLSQDKIKINITASSVESFVNSLDIVKETINFSGRDVILKVNDRSLVREIKNDPKFVSHLNVIFGKTESKTDHVYKLVKLHIEKFGKGPDLKNREKTFNFIISITNCTTLSDDELECVRMKLISPGLDLI